MNERTDFVIVTDWEIVDIDDFYLSDEWAENVNDIERLRQMRKDKELFYAYVVPALDYCIYCQMDARQVFIDEELNELGSCESAIIVNKHKEVQGYDY